MQRPRQGGTENGSSRRLMPGGTPFFERSFHEITNEFCSESVQKLAQKKLNTYQHTDRQTDRSGRSGAALGPCSGQPKRRYQSQNLKKLSPKPSLNPAKIPVKEHLRLASVVALSSSGACGAIIFLGFEIFMFIKSKIMSPYQASKYNGKIHPTDPKNLPKP